MLDDLQGGEAAHAFVWNAAEICQRVGVDGEKSPGAALLDHLRVGIDARRADAAIAQQFEQLAPSAADVDDIARADEAVSVIRLPRANLVARSAKHVLEADVRRVERFLCAAHHDGAGRRTSGRVARLSPGRRGRTLSRRRGHAHVLERVFEDAHARVDERRNLLEVLDQDGVERDERFEVDALCGPRLRQRGRDPFERVRYLLQLVGDGRVQLLLTRENRPDEPPDESREAASQSGRVGRRGRQDDGSIADRLGIHRDRHASRRRVRQAGQRTIDARQRIVVAAIRRIALGGAAVPFAVAHAGLGWTMRSNQPSDRAPRQSRQASVRAQSPQR